MILQKLIFQKQLDGTEKLYYRNRDGQAKLTEEGVVLPQGTELDLGTYFNAFSINKWKKYTRISDVCVMLNYKGSMKLEIRHITKEDKKIADRCLLEQQLESRERTTCRTEAISLPEEGAFSIMLTANTETILYGGSYETTGNLPQRDIRIGVSICTFKREPFVERNLEILKKEILNNENSPAYGKVRVCVSDNGGTLDKERLEDDNIHIVKNKNLGGVGGFTRGMLENMEADENLTHILLMDDDVVIAPSAVERMYVYLSLLKAQFYEYMLGGALMRLDMPCIQFESGAIWNDGDMIANHHNLDMQEMYNCLMNEEESRQDYVGWWYACIPVSLIQEIRLPIPMFLHRDDIEYGLRAHGRFLFLNGICVWHEAFENKCPGVTEYYDVRNLAILNAVHEPEFTALDFKKMLFKQISSNIGKFRYQYVDLNLMGAVDFLRGFKWFYEQDTLKIHSGLAKYNYTMVSKEEYIGHEGLTIEELSIEGEEQPPKFGIFKRLWMIGTMNGHLLPAKKGKPKVTIPYPNIYTLFRNQEVIYVDSFGKAFAARRSLKEAVLAYVKYFRVCALIDKHYDKVCTQYRKHYRILTGRTYWKKYLGMEDNKQGEPEEDKR